MGEEKRRREDRSGDEEAKVCLVFMSRTNVVAWCRLSVSTL